MLALNWRIHWPLAGRAVVACEGGSHDTHLGPIEPSVCHSSTGVQIVRTGVQHFNWIPVNDASSCCVVILPVMEPA